MKIYLNVVYLLLYSTINVWGQSNNWPLPSQTSGYYFDFTNQYYQYLNNTSVIDTSVVKQFLRTEYYWGRRIGTNGNYTDVQKVALQYSLSPICNSADAANWMHVGPDILNCSCFMGGDISGQCSGLISSVIGNVEDINGNSNSVLIGAASAGIWKLNVSTNNWECKTDALRYPGLVISNIVRNPNPLKHNHYIASTGVVRNYGRMYGVGLIKSTDGGENWTIMNGFPVSDLPFVVKVIYDDTDLSGNTVYAITPGSIYKSTDDGLTWSNVDDNLYEIVSYYSNLLSQTIPRSHIGNWWYLYDIQALGNGKFLISLFDRFGTSEGGIWKYDPTATPNWIKITNSITQDQNGMYNRARFSNLVNGKLFVSIETKAMKNLIYKSLDNGATWSPALPSGTTLGYGNKDVIHYSPTKDVLYIAKDDGDGYHALNGASTANPSIKTDIWQGHVDVRDFYIIQAGTNSTPDILLVANDGGITKVTYNNSTNYSYDVTSLMGNSLPIGEYFGIGVSQQGDRLITGAMHNNSFKFSNGQWTQFGMSDGSDAEIDQFDDSRYYYIYGNGNGELCKENGATVTSQYNIYFRSPIELFKKNPDKLVVGLFSSGTLNGGFQIYDRSTNTASTPVRFNDCKGIQAIGINANDELMYAYHSVEQDANHPKLFITPDEGVTNIDLSTKQVNDKFGNPIITLNSLLAWREISDIIFNSENPDEVWIGISGVQMLNGNPNPGYLRVLHSMDKGQTWTDYSEGLPAFPINTFEYIEHSNGLVFVGTDVGVFYRDHSMLNWSCYSNNLPVAIVTDIDYRKCSNELYISTYGRGIWKSPMNISSTSQDYVINNHQSNTWQYKKSVNSDIVIKSGSVLNIVSNLYMAAGKKIIVEPGAKLVIDGGSISSACDDYWHGIEVWGTSNQSQVPHTNGLSDHQGEVEVINGGTIENAINAIAAIKHNPDGSSDWSKTGGIVTLNGAIFKNNNYDLWIGGYRNTLPSSGKVIRNYSIIVNSTFIKDDNMLPGHDGYACVGLVDVGPLMIRGNKFKNLQTGLNTADRGYGIIGYDVSINMTDYCPSTGITHVNLSQSMASSSTPCTGAENNKFEGFYYGVNITNANGLPNTSININHAEFENVYHGIYLNATKYSVVTNCDFTIPSSDPEAGTDPNLYDAYGLYLDGCDGYRVEENHFDKGGDFQGIRGIVVNNTGGNNNELYKNYLANMGYSIQAQKNNRGNGTGLGLYCNEMNNDEGNDIVVLGQGIAAEQKILGTDPNNPYYAAGNIFTSCSGGSSKNFNNQSTGSILYYPDVNSIPLCRYNVNLPSASNYLNRSCPSKLSSSLSVSLSKVSVATVALNSATTILNIWKDGGNANLDNEVKTTDPWDVYVQFNNLISRSPYLSDQVLIETILNPAFNSLMIKLVMIANPQCTRNQEVMDALYNRDPQLPQSYIDEILAGEGTISQLELLEADVAACRHELDANANDAKRYYQMDLDEGLDVLSAYTSFLNALSTFESKIDLAALYFSIDNYEAANSTLANIASNFELSEFQQTDLGYWQTYFTIARDVKEATCKQNVLSDTQISDLTSIADNQNSKVAPYALSLLKINNLNLGYVEPVEPVTENAARKSQENNIFAISNSAQIIKIYPNPANDYLVIEYNIGNPYTKLGLQIIDPTGKIVLSQDLKGGQNEELINISTLKPGAYNASVKGDGKVMSTVKLTVLSK